MGPRTMTLRTYLLLLLLPLITLPLVGIGWMARQHITQNTLTQAVGEAENILRLAREDFLSQFQTAAANLELFSGSSLIREYMTNDSEASRYGIMQLPLLNLFASYGAAYPAYYEIRVLKPDGVEDARFAKATDWNNTLEDESQTPYFQHLRASHSASFLELFRNQDNGEWAFLVAKKMFFRQVGQDPSTPETLRGYLAITLRPTVIMEEIESIHLGAGGFLSVINEAGEQVFVPSWVSLPPNWPPTLLAQVQERAHQPSEKFSFIRTRALARPALVHGMPLPGSLHLVALLWEDELDAQSRPLNLAIAGITAFSILLMLILIYVVMKRLLLNPIIRLSQAAGEVGAGAMDVRVEMGQVEELSSLAQQFNAMVAALSLSHAQIHSQNQELRQLDRMKDDFLANITHELKTPLNGILGLGTALRDGTYGRLDETLAQPMRQIVHSAERLLHLTRQILNFSPQTDAFAQAQVESIWLREYLEQILELFELQAQRQGITLECWAEEEVELNTYRDALDNIFMNLVGNAVKFTHEGGVRITLHTLQGQAVSISVRDTGIGIPEAEHEKIFHRFQQGFASDNRAYEGSGLGLAIVKQSLERLGGMIHLESRVGEGSRFQVVLPLVQGLPMETLGHLLSLVTAEASPLMDGKTMANQEPHDPWPPPLADSILNLEREHTSGLVLVVDDDAINREVVRVNLQHDYDILEASSGSMGLEMLEKNHVDLLLLDLMMPGLSGFDVLEHLRTTPKGSTPPVIVLSARNQSSAILKAFKLGAMDYISKPFHREELLARIQTHIRLHGLHRDLLQEKSYVRNIVDSSVATILVVDAERRIVEYNKAAEQMYGYTAQEVMGQPVSMLHGDALELARFEEKLYELGSLTGELISRRKNGETFLTHVYASLLYDDQGHVIGRVGSSRDITEERRALAEKGEREVAELSNQAKGAFLANMSHEIRTPMNAILGLSELALEQNMPPRVRDYLRKIFNSSQSLLRIINDILDFSKIEAGKLELEQVDFLLRDLFDRLADMFRVPAAKKQLELIMGLSEACRYRLQGDPLRLEQILMNLIGNAIKFTENGEVDVQVRRLQESEGQILLEFSVRDTGMGMDHEAIARIFQPFSQADTSTTRKFGGTGLGLSICQRLVEMMGGELRVESTPKRGSRFYFTMPLGRLSEVGLSSMIPPHEMLPIRVLVVDDTLAAGMAVKEMLTLFGFEARFVPSGLDALDALQLGMDAGVPYQLVLVDWHMPTLGGLATIEKIRESVPPAMFPRILLLVPFGKEEEIQSQGDPLGVLGYITKPVQCSLLFDHIMKAFGREVTTVSHGDGNRINLGEIAGKIGGARILLVEDNVINQQVAKEILEAVSMEVEIAEDGMEALEKVEVGEWDLVLMDIQMPRMDGLEATRHIRANPRFQALPILAMTAHAMTGDREKCLAAGMNDHVSKPIHRHQLYTTLMQWIRPRQGLGQALGQTCEKPHREEEFPLLDHLKGIDLPEALERMCGDRGLLVSILSSFYKDFAHTSQEIRSMISAPSEENLLAASRMAHKIRGVAGNISATQLFHAATVLEKGLKDPSNGWQDALDGFDSALGELLQSIAEMKQQENQTKAAENPDPQACHLDREKILPLAETLLHALQRGKFDAQEMFEQLKPLLAGMVELKPHVQALEEEMESFDFKGAYRTLVKILKILAIDITDNHS